MALVILYALPTDEAARVTALCEQMGVHSTRASTMRAVYRHAEPHSLLLAPTAVLRASILRRLYLRVPTLHILLFGSDGSGAPSSRGYGVRYILGAGWEESELAPLIARWRAETDGARKEEQLSELITLMELGRLLTATLELDELYDQIIDLVERSFEPDRVSLMTVIDEGRQLCLVAARGLEAAPGLTAPVAGDSIAATVVRERRPQLLLGGLQGTRFEKGARGNIGSAMSVPLAIKDEVVGVLNVSRGPEHANYGEREATLLEVFALQIAIALHNAQLYESLREERDRIVRAQEMVRRELARDLHDGLGQVLATLSVNLRNLRSLLERGTIRPDELIEDLTFLGKAARQAVQDARTLTFGLRPLILETQGLGAALEHSLRISGDGTSRPSVELDIRCAMLDRLAPESARMLFAVLQEALTNARKHAAAERVTITIRCDTAGQIPAHLFARVQDDGIGFQQPPPGAESQRVSFGLLNMRERAALLGGIVRVESEPGRGTTVEVKIPWRSAPEEDEE